MEMQSLLVPMVYQSRKKITTERSKCLHPSSKEIFGAENGKYCLEVQFVSRIPLKQSTHSSVPASIQCESYPGRNLKVFDWFIRFGSLFDLDEGGHPVLKRYGQGSSWERFGLPVSKKRDSSNKLKVHLEKQTLLSHMYFNEIGNLFPITERSKKKRNGAQAPYLGTDGGNPDREFPPALPTDRHHYLGQWPDDSHDSAETLDNGSVLVIRSDLISKKVLDKGEFKPLSKLEEGKYRYEALFAHFQKFGFDFQLVTSRCCSRSSHFTAFNAHFDTLRRGVGFLCVNSPFYLVVDLHDTNNDKNIFQNRFYNFLGDHEKKLVDNFMGKFDREQPAIYYCDVDSTVAFRADLIRHGTIIPKSTSDRQLLMFSKLQTKKSYKMNTGDK